MNSPYFLSSRLLRICSKRCASVSTTVSETKISKTLQDIPGPKGLPILKNTVSLMKEVKAGTTFLRTVSRLQVDALGWQTWRRELESIDQSDKVGSFQQELHKKYGKIYKEYALGRGYIVFVADPDWTEQIYRDQDASPLYPSRGRFYWDLIRKELGEKMALVSAEGEEWKRMRSAFNKKLLRVQELRRYSPVVGDTVSDLIKRIHYIQQQHPGQLTIPNLTNEIYRFALETVAAVLFQQRLGCMEPTIPAETQRYIDSIGIMFEETTNLLFLPRWQQRFSTKSYKRAREAWTVIFETARHLIRDKVAAVNESIKSGKIDESVDIVTYVLLNKQIDEKEVYSNLTEILLGGVDTTSNSIVWLLYELAGNPESQLKLRQEIAAVVGDRAATVDDLNRLPYLKACTREVLRMYPVVPFSMRHMKNDIVLGDYFLPKRSNIFMSHWAMSRNDAIFPNANRFIPDRWLREDKSTKLDSFASMPFGFGIRACIGRRLAEMELQMAVARIIQMFDLERDGDAVLTPTVRTILVPKGEVPVRFCPRKKQ